MISYFVYKLIHFLGMFTLVIVLAAASMHVLRGGRRDDNPYRRAFGIVHGVSSFLIILGGFGMLARLGIVQGGLPAWVVAKLAIWLVLSGAIAFVYRGPGIARALLVSMPILVVIAAAIALYKPF
jgi:hypothetical protein